MEDFAAVREAFRKVWPGLVIHCAALANTPACERNPALAHKLNVDVTAMLAELARTLDPAQVANVKERIRGLQSDIARATRAS